MNSEQEPGWEDNSCQSLLDLVGMASQCATVRERLAAAPPPATETLVELHRVLIFNLLSQPGVEAATLAQVQALMKPVLEWERLEERRKSRELAERKYQDQQEAERQKDTRSDEERALTPETLARIERELHLFPEL